MSNPKPLMDGKRGLIMGVANDRSIAWGIATALAEQGAELAFTYQGDALLKRVKPLADSVGARLVLPCDVSDEASIDATFAAIEKEWGKLDFVVHAIAFSDKNELDGKYLNTTRGNFLRTIDISAYSFTAVAQRAVERGCKRVDLNVLNWNPARGFYDRIGFKQLEEWLPYRLSGADLEALAKEGAL